MNRRSFFAVLAGLFPAAAGATALSRKPIKQGWAIFKSPYCSEPMWMLRHHSGALVGAFSCEDHAREFLWDGSADRLLR